MNELTKCYRPDATAGEWMNILLPLAVLIRFLFSSTASEQTSALVVGSLGLLPSVVGTLIARKWPWNSLKLHTFMCCVMSVLLVFMLTGVGLVCSMAVGWFTTFGFQLVVRKLVKSLPLSFTIGEACVVSQGFVLFLLSCVDNIYSSLEVTPNDCMGIATLILQVGLLGVGLISFTVWFLPAFRAFLPFYAVVIVVATGIVVPSLYFLLQFNPVFWIVQLLFVDIYAIALVLYWIICCTLAIKTLAFQVEDGKQASTSIRKYFHVLAVAVFFPGLILQPCLLYLSSGVVLALFLILEVFRILQMPPLGGILQDSYSVFVDEKDAGIVALTPIYLLVGCSVPMWLHHEVSRGGLLPLISGLLSVGVGDTAASIFGHKFGRHKWKESKKTKEGTVASILSQMSVVVILSQFGYLQGSWNEYWKMLVAVVISSLVEAKTDQVDNLCLPLITYTLLNLPFMLTLM